LIDLAKKAGGHDNISADLIEVIESDFPKSKFVDMNNVPNTNTGTQEVIIDPNKKKNKNNKKLVQMILSVAVLIVISGVGYMALSSDEEKTNKDKKVSEVDNKKKLSFEEELLNIDLSQNRDYDLLIIYSALEGSKKGKWDFTKFTDAINNNNFNEINNENREKQKFFIAKDTTIISREKAVEDYKNGDKEFQKGDFIFIMINDLVSEDNSLQDSDDILVPQKKEKEKKIQTKKNVVITNNNVDENKLMKNILAKIVNREIKDIENIDRYEVTFDPSSPPAASHIDKEDKFEVTIKLIGNNDIDTSKVITLNIPYDPILKENKDKEDYNEEVKGLKKSGYLKKLSFDKNSIIPIVDSKEDSKDIMWFKYELEFERVDIKALEDKYNLELEHMKYFRSKGYQEPTSKDPAVSIWFFAKKKSQQNRNEKENPFTKDELDLLDKCIDGFVKNRKLELKAQ